MKNDETVERAYSMASYPAEGRKIMLNIRVAAPPFDRDKIAKSITIALRKRPIDGEAVEKFISKIVRNLEGLGENEIPTSTIGKFIMDGLANLDQVAYVRFASVYRNFKEAKDFEQFIGNLNVYKSE